MEHIEHYLRIAQAVAASSRDPNTKVGAVIVKDGMIVSTGYNGFPRGAPEDWESRDAKDRFVIHAEDNALLHAGYPNTKGASMYTTHRPCGRCAAKLVQSGLAAIVCPLIDGFTEEQVVRHGVRLASKYLIDNGVTLTRVSNSPYYQYGPTQPNYGVDHD